MTALEDLQQQAAQRLDLAKRQVTAIDLVSGLVENLRGVDVQAELRWYHAAATSAPVLTVEVTLPAAAPCLAPVEDLPAAAPCPAPVEDLPAAAPPRQGPFSDNEKFTLEQMHSDGASTEDIAAALGRDRRGVGVQLSLLKKRLAQKAHAKTDQPKPAAASEPPQPAKELQPAEFGQQLELDALTARERAIERRIRAIGYPEPFTPATDLGLAKALAQGEDLANAARAIGIEKPLALRRWQALLPKVTIENQTALLIVLQYRAGELKPNAST